MIKTERKYFVKVHIHKIENEIENIFQNSMCAFKQYFFMIPNKIMLQVIFSFVIFDLWHTIFYYFQKRQ